MKKRKGVILFVTLMMMLLLMGIVSIFLNKTKESKESSSTIYSIIQTNLITKNLLGYLKTVEFDEDMIFYATQAPFPLSLGSSNVILKLDSAHRYLNINSFIRASIEDNLVSDKFISFLLNYRLRDPNLFLNILKDSVDKDIQERSNGSEIVLEYPTFRNGKIYNEIHLEKIVDYYFEMSGDNKIYDIEFDKIFSYTNSSVDINFISLGLMEILFDDANHYLLKSIDDYDDIYEEIDDLPFDEYYTKKVEKGMLGQSISTKTNTLKVKATINYKTQFRSEISFLYNIESKTISDYSIDDISLIVYD